MHDFDFQDFFYFGDLDVDPLSLSLFRDVNVKDDRSRRTSKFPNGQKHFGSCSCDLIKTLSCHHSSREIARCSSTHFCLFLATPESEF